MACESCTKDNHSKCSGGFCDCAECDDYWRLMDKWSIDELD